MHTVVTESPHKISQLGGGRSLPPDLEIMHYSAQMTCPCKDALILTMQHWFLTEFSYDQSHNLVMVWFLADSMSWSGAFVSRKQKTSRSRQSPWKSMKPNSSYRNVKAGILFVFLIGFSTAYWKQRKDKRIADFAVEMHRKVTKFFQVLMQVLIDFSIMPAKVVAV